MNEKVVAREAVVGDFVCDFWAVKPQEVWKGKNGRNGKYFCTRISTAIFF